MPPSSNWLALKKNLTPRPSRYQSVWPKKRRKLETPSEETSEGSAVIADSEPIPTPVPSYVAGNRESATSLRQMVYGQDTYPDAHLLPGKYLAIDCEMVGIAGDPSKKHLGTRDQEDESSLARVSVVNYHGAVQLDVFVRQRERVTDWRTAVSGVRESDMLTAKPFSEVQKLVADLLKDRILIGHAVHNDLKALLLSHPHNMTRDTQVLAGRHGTLSTSKPLAASSAAGPANAKVRINRKPALRKLVKQELGVDIQAGEHSSVIDARATMAIYRLHRKTWDQGFMAPIRTIDRKSTKTELEDTTPRETPQKPTGGQAPSQSRKRSWESVSDDEACMNNVPDEHARTVKARPPASAKRQGISSGLSVVIKSRKGGMGAKQVVSGTRGGGKSMGKSVGGNTKWWGTLGK